MTFTVDERTRKHIGANSFVYLRAHGANGEGGYQVDLWTGQTIRVLPSDGTTARGRLHAISAALQEIADEEYAAFVYLVGALTLAGLSWEVE